MNCTVLGCQRTRARDAAVCSDHLNDLWANRLQRVDGGYVRDTRPEWRRRAEDHDPGRPAFGKDLTGAIAA
jgi:hypothetical protein